MESNVVINVPDNITDPKVVKAFSLLLACQARKIESRISSAGNVASEGVSETSSETVKRAKEYEAYLSEKET